MLLFGLQIPPYDHKLIKQKEQTGFFKFYKKGVLLFVLWISILTGWLGGKIDN